MTSPHDEFVQQVAHTRAGYALPVQAHRLAEEFTLAALALLFPHFAASESGAVGEVRAELERLRGQLDGFLLAQGTPPEHATLISAAFAADLPELHRELLLDARATCEADPAAKSVDEVLLAYPGFRYLKEENLVTSLVDLSISPNIVLRARV